MKRILAVLLAMIMVISFAACGGGEDKFDIFDNSDVVNVNEGGFSFTLTREDSEVDVRLTKYEGSATALNIPKTVKGFDVTAIDDQAFFGCSKLTSVTIPNGVTYIGYQAFGGCASLTSVILPDSVISIQSESFWYCKSLTSISIPNSLTYIGASVFADCSNLKTVYFGSEAQKEKFKDCFGSDVQLIVK